MGDGVLSNTFMRLIVLLFPIQSARNSSAKFDLLIELTEWLNIHAVWRLCAGAKTSDGSKYKNATLGSGAIVGVCMSSLRSIW